MTLNCLVILNVNDIQTEIQNHLEPPFSNTPLDIVTIVQSGGQG